MESAVKMIDRDVFRDAKRRELERFAEGFNNPAISIVEAAGDGPISVPRGARYRYSREEFMALMGGSTERLRLIAGEYGLVQALDMVRVAADALIGASMAGALASATPVATLCDVEACLKRDSSEAYEQNNVVVMNDRDGLRIGVGNRSIRGRSVQLPAGVARVALLDDNVGFHDLDGGAFGLTMEYTVAVSISGARCTNSSGELWSPEHWRVADAA